MASINGISVKGMTKFLGHEGETLFQGNLYLGGKKLGFWSQDAWGGPDRFNLDERYSEKLLNDAIKKLNPHKRECFGSGDRSFALEYDLEIMLGDYIVLSLDEKEYKKAVKSGYAGTLVATDGYHISTWMLPKSYVAMSDGALLKKMEGEIAKAKKSFFAERNGHNKHVVQIYRTFDDFIIGKPIDLKDIMVKE